MLDSLDNYWLPNHTQLPTAYPPAAPTVPEGATYYDSLESSTSPQVTQNGKVAGIDSLSFVVGECIKPLDEVLYSLNGVLLGDLDSSPLANPTSLRRPDCEGYQTEVTCTMKSEAKANKNGV